MNSQLRAEFTDPEERRRQIELSQQQIIKYQQLVDRAPDDNWRQTWLELVKLHQATIEQLEMLEEMINEQQQA